jgi:hypothetical protein
MGGKKNYFSMESLHLVNLVGECSGRENIGPIRLKAHFAYKPNLSKAQPAKSLARLKKAQYHEFARNSP